MKIKGIPVWEQHVDKIVLLVAVVVFVGFVAWQLKGSPNAIDNIDRESRTPGQVDALLVNKAQDLLARMSATGGSEDFPAHDPKLPILATKIEEPVSPTKSLPRVAYDQSLRVKGVRPTGKEYYVPKPAAPAPVMAQQWEDAITPEAVQQHEGLAMALGREQEPFDTQWTTPAAQFAIKDLLQQFRGEGLPMGPDDPTPVPSVWHNDRVMVLDVVVQRQELKKDDSWSDPIEIATLPGRLTFRGIIEQGDVTAQERDEILNQLADPAVQKQIIQPVFYPTKSDIWREPNFDAPIRPLGEEEDPDLRLLQRQIQSVQRDAARVEQLLKENECPNEPPPPAGGGGGENPPAGGRTSGKSGGGGFSAPTGGSEGSGSGGGTAKGSGKSQDDIERKCRPLWKALASHQRRLADLEARLDQLRGHDPEKKLVADVADPDKFNVWAHDINVESGATYRYRLKVRVYNPFFGKKHNLVESQANLAASLVLESPFSGWSEPIRIRDARQFFVADVTPASQQNPLGGEVPLGRAQIEVARFHDGGWHIERFNVSPGDRLGEAKTIGGRGGEPATMIDFSTEWFVVDIIEQPGDQGARNATGIVVLQSLQDGRRVIRDPARDRNSPLLRQIKDRIEAAKFARAE